MNNLSYVDVAAPGPVKAAVIWLHGLGDSGHGFAPIVPELRLPAGHGIRFLFPHAPERPVTINNGFVMRAWYDLKTMDLQNRADEEGVRQSAAQVQTLIEKVIASGVPAEKILLAGFSQGCAMTLQTGLRYPHRLAGLMCLSGYLPLADTIAEERHSANQHIPIFMAHGRGDNVVQINRAEASRDVLQQLGYTIEWHEYMMQHSVCAEEVDDISRWLQHVLKAH